MHIAVIRKRPTKLDVATPRAKLAATRNIRRSVLLNLLGEQCSRSGKALSAGLLRLLAQPTLDFGANCDPAVLVGLHLGWHVGVPFRVKSTTGVYYPT